MAEHPVVLDSKKQVKILVRQPGQPTPQKESVVDTAPAVQEPKKTVGQKLSEYAFGEEVARPGKYVWDSYLAPTGKRVANDIVEHFLLMVKHTFQRWIWNGKTLDDGKFMDRTSFSNYSRGSEPIKAMVMMSPVKELTFATLKDANRVLQELKYTAEQENGYVTVRQYYEASGRPELIDPNGVSSTSGWSVQGMHDRQVIAVYKNFLARDQFRKARKKKKDFGPPCEQMTIFDLLEKE